VHSTILVSIGVFFLLLQPQNNHIRILKGKHSTQNARPIGNKINQKGINTIQNTLQQDALLGGSYEYFLGDFCLSFYGFYLSFS